MSKQLLFSITKKDFTITKFSGTGAGGQYRNKHQNCIRLKHDESGIITTGQSHREQNKNLKEAFNNMVNNSEFKIWLNRKIFELSNQYEKDLNDIENKINDSMKEENLKIEYF